MTYLKDVNIQAADSPSIDAFGRWRTSEQFTLFDSKMLYDKAPDFYDEVTNGTATSNWANSKVTMTVSANNDYVIRQSKVRLTYQPGKSQLVILTGLIGGAAADTVSRLGYFNSSIVAPHTADFDGLYFEQAAGVVTINQRRNGADTGTVAQASWNVDTLDGNGPSAITVDWTVPQIFFMDFEWLGLGRVRFGLVIDGIPVVCHAFNNANSLASALQPYMISPNHSVRYEIRSTGGTSSLEQVCSSVQSEGGFNPNGTDRSYDLGIGPGQQVDADTAGTLYACIGIRLKTTHLDAAIDVLKLSTLCDSGYEFARGSGARGNRCGPHGDTGNRYPSRQWLCRPGGWF